MAAAAESDRCPAACPCRTHTSLEVVPYREAEDCPTDELLLQAWWHGECSRCLGWWAERIWRDSRYDAIVQQVQKKWPRIDVSDLLQTVFLEVCQLKNSGWKCVGACFRRALLLKAFDEHHRTLRVTAQATESQTEASSSDTTAVLASTQHMRELLDDCLQHLSDKERELQASVYERRLSLIEVAKSFQQTHTAVLKQVSRLRAKLRDCIGSKE